MACVKRGMEAPGIRRDMLSVQASNHSHPSILLSALERHSAVREAVLYVGTASQVSLSGTIADSQNHP